MSDVNGKPLSRSEKRELRQFFAWAYWVVGGLCFYWETIVLAALLRVGQEVELPLLGKCGAGEAIIFTLTFFWPVLLVAHQLVFGHQAYAQRGTFSGQFPGVLGDKEIPRALGRLRVILFVILVVWPTFAHVVITVRAFTHMKIVLNRGGSIYPGEEYGSWKALGLLKFPTKDGRKMDGEWRWLHWRDRIEQSPTPNKGQVIDIKLLDAGGKPVAIKFADEDGKPIELTLVNEQAKPAVANKMTLSKTITSKSWVTAIPFWQPWLFVIVAGYFIVSVFWLLGRAWGKRKP